jgi:hypothetical protein
MTRKEIELMVLLQDLCLAFVINAAATILNGGFVTTDLFLVGMFQAFCINYISGLAIPVAKIGTNAAKSAGLQEGSLSYKLLRTFVINAIFVTIVSFTIALINVGPSLEVFFIWIQTYPILHLVGFVTSVLIEDPCAELAGVMLGLVE